MFPFPAEMLLCQAEINVSLERGGCSESCRLSSEPFPLQQKSQELVDKAVFCDTTEVLFWAGFLFWRVRFYLNILSTLSFKLVMCFFLSCLGGKSCFNCLYANAEELGACFHPSALETETKAKQACRWLQILDPSRCPMQLSLAAPVLCCLQNTVLGMWVWTLPSLCRALSVDFAFVSSRRKVQPCAGAGTVPAGSSAFGQGSSPAT